MLARQALLAVFVTPVLVFIVVWRLGKADGSIAVAVTDEGLTCIV